MASQLPTRDSLVVLTYHRIGDAKNDPYDPGIFSATGDQFNEQISYLKRNHLLVTLEEAMAFVDGATKEKTRRCRVLITFDDGYLDNYETAFPILRSQGVQGVFFLCTSLVGSSYVPWWDQIAYVVKTAQRHRFPLRYPTDLDVDLDEKGLREGLHCIFNLYKTHENVEPERFIRELKEAAGGKDLPAESRRYLNWDEAREMISGGMAIGAHTHSHRMLSKLEREEQRKELAESRAILGEQLGIKPDALAYPFGSVSAFSEQTQQLVKETGYRAAFSDHGGTNREGTMRRYNLKRVPVASQSWARFRVRADICRVTGSFWP